MKILISLALTVGLFAASDPASAAGAVRDGFIRSSDQVRIHYLQSGNPSAGHSLLLIPGWRVSASIWSKQMAYFSSQGFSVTAIDSRSQGDSSVARDGNAPEDRAFDIQNVITALRLGHVTLVGWSQGAQDVSAYVEHFGTGALDAIALIDSPVSSGFADVADSPGFVKAILQGIAAYSRNPDAYTDGMMHSIISSPAAPDIFKSLDKEAAKTPADVGISMLIQDLFTTDRRPALKKFDKPTLVVASAESRLLDEQKQMAAVLPHGNFISIQQAAHAVFFDQPDEFNSKLLEFIVGKNT